MPLRLASQSPVRQSLFEQARIPITASPARIDETAVVQSLLAEDASPRDIVDTLAEMKARKLSQKHPNDLVLGCDQIMVLEGKVHGKPKSQDDLKKIFQKLVKTPHQLITGNILYQNGQPIWRHIARVELQMNSMTGDEIDAYITAHWDSVQNNAGGYSFEVTPHLFSQVNGTWFDIMGLSLPQVIDQLKLLGAVPQNHPKPKLAAVLGHPIKHSKSPRLHGYWLKQHQIPGDYSAIDLPPDGFEAGVQALIQSGFSGFNVTIPHKTAALAMADQVSETAQAIGAANTIFVSDTGEITAHNTDAYGFIENIKTAAPDWQAAAGPAMVLGAGGAARAILWALLDAGVPEVLLINRTKSKAELLAKDFGPKVKPIDWDDRNNHIKGLSTLVNTTALGMSGQPPLEIDLTQIDPKALVNDIVYNPLLTDLLAQAKAKGCTVVDGLGMLLHQAVPGFEGWFNHPVQVDEALRQRMLE